MSPVQQEGIRVEGASCNHLGTQTEKKIYLDMCFYNQEEERECGNYTLAPKASVWKEINVTSDFSLAKMSHMTMANYKENEEI